MLIYQLNLLREEIKQLISETAKMINAVNSSHMGKLMGAIVPKTKGTCRWCFSECISESLLKPTIKHTFMCVFLLYANGIIK